MPPHAMEGPDGSTVPMHGGSSESIGDAVKIGILTVCNEPNSGDKWKDLSGLSVLEFCHEAILSEWECVYTRVPEGKDAIESCLKEMIDDQHCSLVLTTGGTGPGPNDNVPEATEAICTKLLPGFGEKMRNNPFKGVPSTLTSRQTAGVRGSALVLNLPPTVKCIRDSLYAVFGSVPYCVDIIGGPYIETNIDVVKAYRPINARRRKAEP